MSEVRSEPTQKGRSRFQSFPEAAPPDWFLWLSQRKKLGEASTDAEFLESSLQCVSELKMWVTFDSQIHFRNLTSRGHYTTWNCFPRKFSVQCPLNKQLPSN